MIMDILFISAVAILSTFILLFLTGLVGPKSVRRLMRDLNRWWYKDSPLFFPMDPYEPISQAVKEGLKNFWPTKRRLQNSFLLMALLLFVTLIGVIISFIFAAHF